MMRCILSGDRAEKAHWPVSLGMGGRSKEEEAKLPWIPLTHEIHMKLHHGDPYTTARVEKLAPLYWIAVGEWEKAQPYYERYMSRKLYLAETDALRRGT